MCPKSNSLLYGIVLLLTVTSCKSEYERLVQQELNTGVVYDSLVLGMHRGMTKKDFYSHCWQLNKDEIVFQGSGNRYALYPHKEVLPSGDSVDVEMLFYGIFDEGETMSGVDLIYSYPGWAPWNEDLQVEALVGHLVWLYERQLGGNPFLTITLDDSLQAHVKVDGDRRILLYPKNEKAVAVKIENLNQKITHGS